MSTDDNASATREANLIMPDSYGHAALLLVERLIHGLIERGIISVDDAIEIVEGADSVQVDIAGAADGHGAPMWHSHALLSAIAESLRSDVSGTGPPLNAVQ